MGVLFESASGLTRGLFKNILQVASWPIIWSVLSAFIKALPFSLVYSVENGDVVAIAGMNLIFAIALLFTPLLVSQLCEGVSLSVGATIKGGVLTAVSLAMGPKGFAFRKAASTIASKAGFHTGRLNSESRYQNH